MFNANPNRAKLRSYALPPFITCVGMILIMIIKQIYPFGSMGLGYNDNMHQVVPMYSLIWDVLHGRASSVYSLQIGMGTDLTVMRSTYSLLSPFNLLLLLTPRSYILGFISVMTIVKMSCMSVAMYFFFNHDKAFAGTSYAFKVLFSVMYAFSGYVLLYASCFSPWMDVVVIFPVFMLALNKIFYTGNKFFYTVMVAAMLIMNSWLGIMAIIYAFIMTGGYVLFVVNKEDFATFKSKAAECGKIAGNVLAGTLLGMGIASFVLVPCVTKVFNGEGWQIGFKQYMEALAPKAVTQMDVFQHFMVFYGLAFAVAMIIVGIIFYKKEKKTTRYIIFSLAVVLLPAVFWGIERIWNMKPYDGYSMHFGFITVFAIISAGCYFSGKPMKIDSQKAEQKIETNFEPLEKLVYILSGMVICAISAYIYNKLELNDVKSALTYFVIVFCMLIMSDVAMCIVDRGVLCAKCCYVATAIEIFIGIYAMMGVPRFYDFSAAQSANHALLATKISSDMEISNSHTEGIKNPDLSLGTNYSLILQRPAVTSDFNSYDYNFSDAEAFGYGVYASGATDAGGTAFSDALLGITDIISMNEEDEVLYRKVKSSGGFNLYSARFTLPYAMTVDSGRLENADPDDWISMHNAFFSAIMGRDGVIVERAEAVNDAEGSYVINVADRRAVYIRVDSDVNLNIKVNGENIVIPESGRHENTLYKTEDDKRLLYLGTFENEDVEVVLTDENQRPHNAVLDAGLLNISELAVVCNMMNSNSALSAATYEVKHGNVIKLQVSKSKGRDMLILPVTYDENWRVEINGLPVQPVYAGNKIFTGIRLKNGENTIRMSYVPKGTEVGMALSVITILMIIGAYSMTRNNAVNVPDIVKTVTGGLFIIIWAVIMLAMFIVPVIAAAVNVFVPI